MTLGAEHPATLATINDFSVLGPEHRHSVESLNQLVGLYGPWNRPDEAEKWRAKLTRRDGAEEED